MTAAKRSTGVVSPHKTTCSANILHTQCAHSPHTAARRPPGTRHVDAEGINVGADTVVVVVVVWATCDVCVRVFVARVHARAVHNRGRGGLRRNGRARGWRRLASTRLPLLGTSRLWLLSCTSSVSHTSLVLRKQHQQLCKVFVFLL
jgi:hypothetical protein